MLIKPVDFRITPIISCGWNNLRLRWAHKARRTKWMETEDERKKSPNKININNSLVWLYSKEEEKENECRQRFSRACIALTQARSHMQSNKCQSKLNFTEDDEFTRRARACAMAQCRRNGKWAHRSFVGRQQFFFSFVVCLLLPSPSAHSIHAYATAICTHTCFFLRSLFFFVSTWRNNVRWHGCLLLATEMSLIHISIEI